MSFDFDHAHKRRQEIAKSTSGSFNTNNLEKSEAYQDTVIGTPFDNQSRIAMNISQSYSNAPEISKAEEEELEKGGKKAFIGETRTHGGREYIRTANGWKFHGKGTGKKAAEHKASAASHTKEATSAAKSEKETRISLKEKLIKEGFSAEEAKDKVEGDDKEESTTEKKSSKKEVHPEGTVREFGGRNYIKKDGKWKYHPKGASKSTEESASKNVSLQDLKESKNGTVYYKGERTRSVYPSYGYWHVTFPEGSKMKDFQIKGGDNVELKHFKIVEEKKEASKSTEEKKESSTAFGKHISDMSATEKKVLADKLGVDVKGKTVKQVDKALSDAMVDKQMADWKASKTTTTTTMRVEPVSSMGMTYDQHWAEMKKHDAVQEKHDSGREKISPAAYARSVEQSHKHYEHAMKLKK